jgi:hypothetical protein
MPAALAAGERIWIHCIQLGVFYGSWGERARVRGPGNGDAERQGCGPTGSRKAATGLDECRHTTDRPHANGVTRSM